MFNSCEKESLEDTEYITRVLENLEFDGTQVLCRVCGDKASGFHYGVHSCEGCKGFFRRSIQQKIQYRPCTKNQQCSIQRVNRNRCQYCRLKKCIAVGMSRDAVRFGRVPKREKARIIAAMQTVQCRTLEKSLLSELDDESNAINAIVQAYMDTCEYTSENIKLLRNEALSKPMYTYDPQSACCPLFPTSSVPNQSSFSARFSKAIRGVINFALRLPGFSQIPTEDRFLLLKSGAFEALLVSLTGLYECESNTFLCMNGRFIRREFLHSPSNSRFLMDSVCDFAERLNLLNLTDAEFALFVAVVLISPDRHGIRHRDLVDRFHDRLTTFLQNTLLSNHFELPNIYQELMAFIPDLRTLNALHSDKSFCQRKMEQSSNSLSVREMSCPSLDMDSNTNSPYSSSCSSDHDTRSSFVDLYPRDSSCSPNQSFYCNEPSLSVNNNLVIKCRRREPSEGGSSSDENLELNPKYLLSKRKVENPDDSGIESDKISLPSICSSPRSSIDEKVEDDREEDMPVLRRALQAPPIMNTDWIMEEAYKPHKKFRAFRKEEHPTCSSSSSSVFIHKFSTSSSEPESSILASALTSPSLTKSLSEKPKMPESILKRADVIHSLILENEERTTENSCSSNNSSHFCTSGSTIEENLCSSSPIINDSSVYINKERIGDINELLPNESISTMPEIKEFPLNFSRERLSSYNDSLLHTAKSGPTQPLNLSKKKSLPSTSTLRIKV